jgi:MFS family permease
MCVLTERRWLLVAASCASFVTASLLNILNVAVPVIELELQVSAVDTTWVAASFLLCSGALVLPFAQIANRIGRRRAFSHGLLIVVASSVLHCFVDTYWQLIVIRVLQAIGTAFIYATSHALVSAIYPAKQRGVALGVTVSSAYIGLTLGPLIGGLLTEMLGWRTVMLWPVPLAGFAWWILNTKIDTEWRYPETGKVDLRGTALLAVLLFSSYFGITLLPAFSAIALLLTACIAGYVFLQVEKRSKHAIFDPVLFSENRMLRHSVLASFLLYSVMYSVGYIISIYLQFGSKMNAGEAGLIMLIQPLMMALMSPVAGRLSDHHEPRLLATGGVIITAIGLLVLAGLPHQNGAVPSALGLLLVGVGFGLFSAPNFNAVMSSVGSRDMASAGAIFSTARVMGQLMGMANIALVFALGPVLLAGDQIQFVKVSFLLGFVFCLPALSFSYYRGNVRSGPERE